MPLKKSAVRHIRRLNEERKCVVEPVEAYPRAGGDCECKSAVLRQNKKSCGNALKIVDKARRLLYNDYDEWWLTFVK